MYEVQLFDRFCASQKVSKIGRTMLLVLVAVYSDNSFPINKHHILRGWFDMPNTIVKMLDRHYRSGQACANFSAYL